ncbi:hypothetical protein CLAFUW4_07199 [Fulvia fulva]|uniref:Uncharacterized protein n=1 Tax=Passalora fulva TaxID=5499 RepID=A0A9Q8PAH3_PASFU|nr:uncharacterized protein CLAFUR5_07333 [Fulvia fulva]KAK4621602.1 hypothetical protein CLAFUR4_07207 [Fulvia fulva]KAK4623212.1 hypothetical protein CLAFUR0_07204 [Fulvia fulva]UJO18903.1 hypothetical protein CLAFUR5_07333 [Fulvia fulva]WPV16305.1 hypothetical protein CLAFUW4_07199 [Fulvia fulva]WPV30814.1 hypothetical protein CLAFUW7_07200 [Fulvia fulva]
MTGRPCDEPQTARFPFLAGCCSIECEQYHKPVAGRIRLLDPQGYNAELDRDILLDVGGMLVDVGASREIGWYDRGEWVYWLNDPMWELGRTNLTDEEQEKYCGVVDEFESGLRQLEEGLPQSLPVMCGGDGEVDALEVGKQEGEGLGVSA